MHAIISGWQLQCDHCLLVTLTCVLTRPIVTPACRGGCARQEALKLVVHQRRPTTHLSAPMASLTCVARKCCMHCVVCQHLQKVGRQQPGVSSWPNTAGKHWRGMQPPAWRFALSI